MGALRGIFTFCFDNESVTLRKCFRLANIGQTAVVRMLICVMCLCTFVWNGKKGCDSCYSVGGKTCVGKVILDACKSPSVFFVFFFCWWKHAAAVVVERGIVYMSRQ